MNWVHICTLKPNIPRPGSIGRGHRFEKSVDLELCHNDLSERHGRKKQAVSPIQRRDSGDTYITHPEGCL